MSTYNETGSGGVEIAGSISQQCQLRLDAGKITEDVGFLWLPLKLQLYNTPSLNIDQSQLEFFQIDGSNEIEIPFLERANSEGLINGYVYLQPEIESYVYFYVRITS